MTDTEILDKIGKGMVLSVPHDRKYTYPELFDGFFKFGHKNHRPPIRLTWEDADRFLINKEQIICKAEKEDTAHKVGWKSKGWLGEHYDYYRMIQ